MVGTGLLLLLLPPQALRTQTNAKTASAAYCELECFRSVRACPCVFISIPALILASAHPRPEVSRETVRRGPLPRTRHLSTVRPSRSLHFQLLLLTVWWRRSAPRCCRPGQQSENRACRALAAPFPRGMRRF